MSDTSATNALEVACRLAGGVAHDMNNILLVVQGYTEMALAEEDAGPSTRALLAELRDATTRATLLMHDLLVVGQKGQIAARRIDVNALVRQALAAIGTTVGDGVAVRQELCAEALPILADDELVTRMLTALAARAKEAMPEGGTLTLSTARVGDSTVALRVTDTGAAIPEDARARIFEPYVPGRSGGKGLGLGMIIPWGAARRLGATIGIESSSPAGTTFLVELPLSAGVVGAATPRATPADEPGASSKASRSATILVADDDESLLGLATKILTREGFSVVRAADGQEAVDIFEKEHGRIDLVILDDVMPRMGGRAAIARIRNTEPGVPVILCSGYTWSLDGTTRDAGGTYELLPKPWQPRELVRRVHEGLEKKG
ncbi:MAG TPA: response regulator [Spirochaetia bacterium]